MTVTAVAETGLTQPTAAAPVRADAHTTREPQAPWPAGCEVLPVTAAQLTAYLDACLERGVDVEAAADGWVLVRGGDRRVVLLVT